MSKAIWVLHLPIDTKVLVSPKDKVNWGDVLAKKADDKFISPVDGQILEIDNDRIKLKFKTEKIFGQAVGQGKHWGQLVNLSDKKFWQLSAKDCRGKLAFVSKLSSVIFTKLKALDVSGIVCLEQSTGANFPLLKIDKKVFDKLKSAFGTNCLLDIKNSVLLIPEESHEKK